MPTLRALVTWPFTTGKPEDVSQNVWHFNVTDPVLTAAPLIHAALDTFYDDIYGNDQRSPLIDHDAGTIKIYNLDDPEPRVPVYQDSMAVLSNSAGGTALPTEVSVVASLYAAQVSGGNRRRRRGRLYFGPWSTTTLSGGTGALSSSFVDNLDAGLEALFDASEAADPGWVWAIYSPTDEVARQVVKGYVDSEFDTQRRRGIATITRRLFGNW